MCLGALYMSSVHHLVYAARDPWAGSANLLGTTPYLSRKPIHTSGPPDSRLEVILIGWLVENDLVRYGEEILPLGIELGITLYHSQELRQMQSAGLEIPEIIDRLVSRVK